MPANSPPGRRAFEPHDTLDRSERETAATRAPGDRRRNGAGAMIVAFLLLVGIIALIVLI
jgi:hypothetical protein